jgi:hypothetical protein
MEGVMATNAVHNANMKSSGQLLLEFINSSAESSAELRRQRNEAYIKRKLQAMVAEKKEKTREKRGSSETTDANKTEPENQQKRIDKKV